MLELILFWSLLYFANRVLLMLTSIFKYNIHKKRKEACIKTRSPSASRSLKGWDTKRTSVKRSIAIKADKHMSQSHLNKTQIAGTKPRAALNLLLIGWENSASGGMEQYKSKTNANSFRHLTMLAVVVYPWLQNVFGKSCWKKSGTRRLRSSQWKISSSNGTREKVVLISRSGSKRKFMFFKATFGFFGKWDWFVQIVNTIPGRNLSVLNFSYH